MSDLPRRIQRQRTKGWRMPENAVYVGRPTKWGNPYVANAGVSLPTLGINAPGWTRAEVVQKYRDRGPQGDLAELRGRDLVCWCPLDQPCHADVLLEWANEVRR